MSNATVVVICPCCASVTQGATNDPCPQAFTCQSCGQGWWMIVDANRHEEHALT